MNYRIEVAPGAMGQLRRLDLSSRLRAQGAIELLAEQPRPVRAERIRGGTEEWRVRTGGLRLTYLIDDEKQIVRIVALGRPVRAIPKAPRLAVPPPQPDEPDHGVDPAPVTTEAPEPAWAEEPAPRIEDEEAPHGRAWFWRRNGH